MLHRIPRPTPALGVALVALFVALSGTAVAAGVVAHARLADNAKRLVGKTPAQVAAMAPAPSSLAGYITVKTASWSLNANQGSDFKTACDAGQKAIAGGFDNPQGAAIAIDTRPSPDGSSWQIYLLNVDDTAGASGSLYAVCMR
jgi:hypothetical protein